MTVYDNVGSVMSSMIAFSKIHGSPALTSQIKENGVFLVVLTPVWLCIFSDGNREWPTVHLTDVTKHDWGSFLHHLAGYVYGVQLQCRLY